MLLCYTELYQTGEMFLIDLTGPSGIPHNQKAYDPVTGLYIDIRIKRPLSVRRRQKPAFHVRQSFGIFLKLYDQCFRKEPIISLRYVLRPVFRSDSRLRESNAPRTYLRL